MNCTETDRAVQNMHCAFCGNLCLQTRGTLLKMVFGFVTFNIEKADT